jgi:uncharacterized protein YeaO (DUF488 family)
MIQLKRAYDKPSPSDGERILVERLWPRGLTKARAAVDLWLKDVAPSPELRKWFGHDSARWKQFERRYWKELQGRQETVEVLRQKAKHGCCHPRVCCKGPGTQQRAIAKRVSGTWEAVGFP